MILFLINSYEGEKKLMNTNIDFSIAMNTINMKIAEFNMKILENDCKEYQEKLNKYLNIRKQLSEGNMLLVKKIIDGEI